MAAPNAHLLRTLAAVSPGSRVLDLGCGDGRHTDPLVRLGFDVWACAEAPNEVEATRERLTPLLGEGEASLRITPARPEALGYPDAHFDWVVACAAWHEETSERAWREGLAEALRVLKPGGWFIVSVPASLLGPTTVPARLTQIAEAAGFALSEVPVFEDEAGQRHVRGIYRRVDAATMR